MKKILLKSTKRISIVALAILLVFSLTACSSFEQRLTGLTEAMMFMVGEPNLNASEVVTIRFSEDASPMSLADFIAALIDVDEDLESALALIENLEISIASEAKIYGSSMSYSLYWIGPENTREEIIRIIYIDEDLYISATILNTILTTAATLGELFEDEGIALILEMIGDLDDADHVDYIHITVPAMMSLAEFYADEYVVEFLENFDLTDIISTLGSMMSAELENALDRSLARDFDQALQKIDGEYILTMNTQLAIEFAKALLQLVIEYEWEILEFAANVVEMLFNEEISADARIEAIGDLEELASEALAFLNDNEFINNLPLINFEYRIKATGEGTDKVQTSSTHLKIPTETMDMLREGIGYDYNIPFQKIEIIVEQTISIQTTPITAPQGEVFSLDELFGDFMSHTIMHHFDFYDWDMWIDDFDFYAIDIEEAIAEIDLNQIAADFGIDLSHFGIDLSDIDLNDIAAAANALDFDFPTGARVPRARR